jgi:prolyl-tRNA editing enzyme YbaK/EbsC (Cys-tRNA(Pro) deacylase)
MQEARALHVEADEVLKTIALRTREKYALVVLPASCRLDMRLVRDALEDPAEPVTTIIPLSRRDQRATEEAIPR